MARPYLLAPVEDADLVDRTLNSDANGASGDANGSNLLKVSSGAMIVGSPGSRRGRMPPQR